MEQFFANVRNIPFLYSIIRKRKPAFITDEYLIQLPKEPENKISAGFFMPIVNFTTVIGFVYLMPNETYNPKDEARILYCLEIFGNTLGNILNDEIEEHESHLSRREIEVLERMSYGETTKEIAVVLGISEFTVKEYVKSIFNKLDVNNRVQAVAVALRTGIIK